MTMDLLARFLVGLLVRGMATTWPDPSASVAHTMIVSPSSSGSYLTVFHFRLVSVAGTRGGDELVGIKLSMKGITRLSQM